MAEENNTGASAPLAITGPTSSPAPSGATGFGVADTVHGVWDIVRRGDMSLAVAVAGILVILIIPLPAWLLDILLAVSLTLAVLILMVVIFIQKAMEMNTFPILLLLTTLFRLSLNLASTRLILSNGSDGTEAAGKVIQAFAGFIMSGNFVIGVIIFSILVIVNFMVITKGSGRIAEVTARFTLDAMPGKQMAIDADLSAGNISEKEALSRRKDLQTEADFFGAMDGASKFVRGEAVAGLMVVGINVVAGIIIGMVQHGMTFIDAADTFTRLSVGDGLVTQIPALIISVAAGIMVSKAGLTETTNAAIGHQLGGYPKALGMSSAVALAMAIVPGTPALPFLLLAGLTGSSAYFLDRKNKEMVVTARTNPIKDGPVMPTSDEPIGTALKIDMVRLELGYGLIGMISAQGSQRLTDQIKSLRRALATEMGFVMPAIRIQDNMQLPANSYVIFVKEVEAGRGELRPNHLLVMDPRGEEIQLPGEKTREPTFGLPAQWIDNRAREEALFRGYTVVDPPTVVTTHLTEVVRDNMSDLLSYVETQKLLDELDKEHQKLVADLIPSQISMNGLQRVLQNLLNERISIRDLATILEGISEAGASSRNVMMITEHVRSRLASQISDNNSDDDGIIPLVTLSPAWEKAFAEALTGPNEEKQLAMPPSQLQEFITAVRNVFERFAMRGETPILLTSPAVRPYVRSVVERFRPMTTVMSQNEIHPKARIKTLGQV